MCLFVILMLPTMMLIGASLSKAHSYMKMVWWSMRDKQRQKAGLQHTSVNLVRWFMYKQTR